MLRRNRMNWITDLAVALMLVLGAFLVVRCSTVFIPAATVSTGAQSDETPLVATTSEPVPTDNSGTIFYEAEGELYGLPVDEQGNVSGPADRVSVALETGERIIEVYPSPDGTKAIFFTMKPAPPEGGERLLAMYILMLPDKQVLPLFGDSGWGQGRKFFGWHPNSQQIIYGGEGPVWLHDVLSDKSSLIVDPQGWADLPYPPLLDGVAYSPDGTQLIISYTLTGDVGETWVVNADGSQPKLLLKEPYRISRVTWSPDGKLVAFAGDGIEVMARDGQNRRRVGSGFIGGLPPVWSPDGRYLIFTASGSDPSGYRIRIVDVETGTEKDMLSDAGRSDVLPTWSPDGAWILFLSDWTDERGGSEVWMAHPDGSDPRQLTSDGKSKRTAPIWLSALAPQQ